MSDYDVIVVGGGPAGLTAALYASRAGKSVCVLEKEGIGGQIVFSPMVDNYPALPHVSGADFANRLYEQAESLGAAIETEEVLSVTREGEQFRVRTDFGEKTARAVILATGVRHRTLGVAGESDLVGAGVSYCAVCDGAFYAGKSVAVVGGGDTALQDALFLSGICKSVTLIHRRDTFRAEAALVEKVKQCANVTLCMQRTVDTLVQENGALTALTLRGTQSGETQTLPVDGLFVAVGQQPQSDAFSALVPTDEQGYFPAGEDAKSGTDGVFIAGDCRCKQVRQLTTAVGDGAAAALAACAYLER